MPARWHATIAIGSDDVVVVSLILQLEFGGREVVVKRFLLLNLFNVLQLRQQIVGGGGHRVAHPVVVLMVST